MFEYYSRKKGFERFRKTSRSTEHFFLNISCDMERMGSIYGLKNKISLEIRIYNRDYLARQRPAKKLN